MICDTKFTLFTRRRHCRVCGKAICSKCSKFRQKGQSKKSGSNTSKDEYRACNDCFVALQPPSTDNNTKEDEKKDKMGNEQNEDSKDKQDDDDDEQESEYYFPISNQLKKVKFSLQESELGSMVFNDITKIIINYLRQSMSSILCVIYPQQIN